MECDVIRDLIPLYAEDMLSDASEKLVEDHLGDCEDCRRYLDNMKLENTEKPNKNEPLSFLNNTLGKDRKLQGLMIGSFFLSVFLVIASFLTYPHPVDYKDGLVTKDTSGDKVNLSFSEEVTSLYVDGGYGDVESSDSPKTIFLDGSYTYLDRMLGGKSVGYQVDKADVDAIMYNNNGDNFAKVLYDPHANYIHGGRLVLPRLALGIYAKLVTGVLLIFIVLILTLLRKKDKYFKIRFIALPASYLLANFLIKGTDLSSHHLIRDLGYILVTSIALYLFIYSITLYFERKERLKLSF